MTNPTPLAHDETHSAPPIATMPTWYIPHGGGPCFFMDWNPPGVWDTMEAFLRALPDTLPARPQAIIIVSAHWQEENFSVTAGSNPSLIYDYYGFPPHTYALQYPAPGNPALAERVVHLLSTAGLKARLDPHRGFDHGMFIPLMVSFPDADIPVIQLSLSANLDPGLHIQAGRALQSLREEGVLIIGSGMSFHNLALSRDPRVSPYADQFDQWLTNTIESAVRQRTQALIEWENAPAARICHPQQGDEHLLPMMVIAGAAGNDDGQCIYSDRVQAVQISAYAFQRPTPSGAT